MAFQSFYRFLGDKLTCNFEENDMCNWMFDPRDTTVKWKISFDKMNNKVLCMNLVNIDHGNENAISGRLWSDLIKIKDDNKIKCLTFQYKKPISSTVAILRHSLGYLPSDKI